MAGKFYLGGRTANNRRPVYYSGSHRSVDEALRVARRPVLDRDELVWIVDDEGNLVLPADQVRVRLNHPSLSV